MKKAVEKQENKISIQENEIQSQEKMKIQNLEKQIQSQGNIIKQLEKQIQGKKPKD